MTYQLHLLLNAEELVLRVGARVGAVWQVGDEVEARDERFVVLGELIGKLTLIVRSRDWEDALVLGRCSICFVQRGLVVRHSGLDDVAAVIEAVGVNKATKLRRVESWISSAKGTGSGSKASGRL